MDASIGVLLLYNDIALNKFIDNIAFLLSLFYQYRLKVHYIYTLDTHITYYEINRIEW